MYVKPIAINRVLIVMYEKLIKRVRVCIVMLYIIFVICRVFLFNILL